jgi:ribonuclease HI
MTVHARFDGAAKSAVLSAIGIVVDLPSGPIHISRRVFVPHEHNRIDINRIEYTGLRLLLEYVLQSGHRELEVESDSEIVVRQISGGYECRSQLAPFYEACLPLIRQFSSFNIVHIQRAANSEANELAKQALLVRKKHKGRR